jgi:hypothetical protein
MKTVTIASYNAERLYNYITGHESDSMIAANFAGFSGASLKIKLSILRDGWGKAHGLDSDDWSPNYVAMVTNALGWELSSDEITQISDAM